MYLEIFRQKIRDSQITKEVETVRQHTSIFCIFSSFNRRSKALIDFWEYLSSTFFFHDVWRVLGLQIFDWLQNKQIKAKTINMAYA